MQLYLFYINLLKVKNMRQYLIAAILALLSIDALAQNSEGALQTTDGTKTYTTGTTVREAIRRGTLTGRAASPNIATYDFIHYNGKTYELTESSLDFEKVVEVLTGAGWDAEALKASLDEGETYNIWQANASEEGKSWLAAPVSDTSKSVMFSLEPTPGGGTAEIITAGLFEPSSWGMPSKEEMQKRIVDTMQSTIDLLCAMDARPVEITAKGSVPGFLEIGAKWETDKICSEKIADN